MIKKNYPANTPERKNLSQQAEYRIYIAKKITLHQVQSPHHTPLRSYRSLQ